MEDMRSLLAQAIDAPQPEMPESERRERAAHIGRLFKLFSDLDAQKAAVYAEETAEIPLDKLRASVRLVMRTHRYPSMPSIADLWRIARFVAGMHRQQYQAGRYLSAPRDWPPEGQRHAIERGLLEPVAESVICLPEGLRRPLLESGESE